MEFRIADEQRTVKTAAGRARAAVPFKVLDDDL
jgi:hypothetical protein